MAKSELKTLISQLFNIDRKEIIFDYNDLSISVDGDTLLEIDLPEENKYCCGIYNIGNFLVSLPDSISEENKINLVQKLMTQLLKMVAEYGNKGLVTFSHIEDNIIVKALTAENYEGPWKLASSFINPDTKNKVYYFVAEINQ